MLTKCVGCAPAMRSKLTTAVWLLSFAIAEDVNPQSFRLSTAALAWSRTSTQAVWPAMRVRASSAPSQNARASCPNVRTGSGGVRAVDGGIGLKHYIHCIHMPVPSHLVQAFCQLEAWHSEDRS